MRGGSGRAAGLSAALVLGMVWAARFPAAAHAASAQGTARAGWVLVAGARLDGAWPQDGAGQGPAALEPRAGVYGAVRLCGEAGPWRWGLAEAADGLAVPFRPAHGRWDPEALGLRDPPTVRGRLDALWLEYGSPAAGVACAATWAGPGWTLPASGPHWRVWAGRRPLEPGGLLGATDPPTAPGLDQVGAELAWGPVAYRKAVARLDRGARYLLVHRLYLGPLDALGGRLHLSFYEMGVVSPRFAALPVTWVPLWPGYLTQDLEMGGVGNDDANFYMGLTARLERTQGWVRQLTAEVLVDDMPQVPWKRQVYQLGGAVAVRLAGGLELRYARVNNYVITFQEPSLSLVDQGRPLAYPDGPDVDAWKAIWPLPGGWRLSLEWRRRGEGRIGDAWEWEPERVEAGKAREFLAGTVEHTVLAGVEAARGGLRWRLEAGPVIDAANVPGARSVLVRLAASFAG